VAPDAAAALGRMSYGAFLCVAVETREAGRMPWDDVYAMATPGRAFDMFTNQAHVLRPGRERRPGGTLMLFAGGPAAAALMAERDAVITERFLADLHGLYPRTRGAVADAVVHRWPLGNVYARPGRRHLQAPLEGALGPHRNLHLAGDYFAELGNLEAAARTGLAAAERVEAGLREHPARPLPRSETQRA
jgi:protoporphyrinogen oxidase